MKVRSLILLAAAFLLPGLSVAQVTARIDAAKTFEPINPYIYGQFIEHLGRCIYGGIWAEMVEDRKFYYPVTDKYAPWGKAKDPQWDAGEFPHLVASPWKVLAPGTVTMDTVNAYVGRHTPVVHLPGGTPAGISQEGLAVVGGKRYSGRVVLAGDRSAAPVLVSLIYDDGTRETVQLKNLSDRFTTYPIRFAPKKNSENVRIEIVSRGTGTLRIGTLSLMPADNIKGWRSDVVALLKELDSPIYRWPGGNFVSGYNWRDGIGPRDTRPPRKNPAWTGVEHNDVGIHEFMELMDMIDSEPYIAVNTGLGTVDEVAEEVAYFNAPASTPMGQIRAKNGHPAPYKVTWWAVGNEMFGNWQLGHMPLEEYVQKHNRVAEAMWKVDPSIKLVGVGEVGRWSETMMKNSADFMNGISEHIYTKEKPDVPAHTRQLVDLIRRRAEAHRKYRDDIPGLAAKDIRIAMDEWNYWYGDYVYGELGVRYHLKDALGIAAGLHEYFRNSDIYFMANYAQTVNVIGAIKTTRTAADFDATGLALTMYRRHFGTIPVSVSGDFGTLDVAAAWTPDRKALTVAVVNPEPGSKEVSLDLSGVTLSGKATRWVLSGSDPNQHDAPGKQPRLRVVEERASGSRLSVPGYGVALYRLEAK